MYSLKGRNDKPYLLDSSVQSDDPLSIYKSLWQILYENSIWILILVGIVLAIFVFLFCKKKKKAEEPKGDKGIEISALEKKDIFEAITDLENKILKIKLTIDSKTKKL